MKIKKNYLDAIKCTLKCFPLLNARIDLLNKKLIELKWSDGIHGVSSDNTRVQTSNINKIVENVALNNIDTEREIISEIKECERKIDLLSAAIDKLDVVTSAVIKLKFMDNKAWLDIEYEVGYSERQCRNKMNQGMLELAIIFYGERALETKLALEIN